MSIGPVEHMTPREWREHWPVNGFHGNGNERIVNEQRREDHVQRLGSLTPANDRLNPSMGHAPWTLRRTQLREHSGLRMNAGPCDAAMWGETLVRARGQWLAEESSRVCEGPDAETWNL